MEYQSVLPKIIHHYRVEGSFTVTDQDIRHLRRFSIANATNVNPDLSPAKIEWEAEKRLWDFLRRDDTPFPGIYPELPVSSWTRQAPRGPSSQYVNLTAGSKDNENDETSDSSNTLLGSNAEGRASSSLSPPGPLRTRVNREASRSPRINDDTERASSLDQIPSASWTEEDQIGLEATSDIAPCVIPEGHTVQAERDNEPFDSNRKQTIRNTNWALHFCNRFNALLCCPAFNTNLSLLHLAIRTALYYRLGDSSNRSKLNVNGSSFEVQNDTLSAGSGATLIEDVGDQQPDHREFLNYLRDAMKDLKEPRGPRPKRGEGITVGDLTGIQTAWDRYATKKNQPGLKSIKEYQRDFNATYGNDLTPKESVLELKKRWILENRKDED